MKLRGEIFKGYVELDDNKCPIEPYRTKSKDELRTYEQIRYTGGFSGVIDEGITLVDVDDSEQAEKLLTLVRELEINTTVVNTTRGKHFYFKTNPEYSEKNTNGRLTPIGINVDYKHGMKGGLGHLKLNGQPEREVVYETDTLDMLPMYLADLGSVGKHSYSIADLDEGQRNDGLFKYILTLQSKGFIKDEIRDIIKVVNNYIIENPVSDSELDTILRDEAFKKESYFIKGVFQFDKFAKDLMKKYNIIEIDGEIHIYNNGIYVRDTRAIELAMIKELTLRESQRKEVMKYLDLLIYQNTRGEDGKLKTEAGPEWIAFNNGLYNVETDEFREFTPDIIVTNKIPHDYNTEAKSDIVDKALRDFACDNDELVLLLEEVAGSALYRSNRFQKMYVLTGNKGNGKSTYLDMIKTMLGEGNYASLDMKQLGQRFQTAELADKMANIGDDIANDFIKDTEVLKKLVTGESLQVERKGRDPFNMIPRVKLFFSANDMPKTNDRTGAVLRRLLMIPFNADFSEESGNRDINMKYNLVKDDAIEYFIQVSLNGLRRLLKNGRFTEPQSVKDRLEEYKKENNPIMLWYEDEDIEHTIEETPYYSTVDDIYSSYKFYCEDNGYIPLSKIQFNKQMEHLYGYKRDRIYINTEIAQSSGRKAGGRLTFFVK